MQSMVTKVVVLVLAGLFYCGWAAQCKASEGAGAPAPAAEQGRQCIANFSIQGSWFSGRVVRTFQEYPNVSKGPTFTYLIAKLASIGYRINSSDKETGLISASYQVSLGKGETTSLNAVVTELTPTGVRVDLTFTAGGGVSFSRKEAEKEFCSILEGVPSDKPRTDSSNSDSFSAGSGGTVKSFMKNRVNI